MGSSANLSKYDTTYSSNQSFTFDSTNSCYKITRSSAGFGTILVKDITVPNSVEFSFKFKTTTYGASTNTQPKLALFNGSSGLGVKMVRDTSYIGTCGYTSDGTRPTGETHTGFSGSNNVWYLVKFIVNGTSISAQIYNESNTLVSSASASSSVLASTGNKVAIQHAYDPYAVVYFKEIMVKPI